MAPYHHIQATEAVLDRPMFKSFFMGGFECSTHYARAGRRLDLVASTRHDVWALKDYARFKNQGLRTAREGVRWHLVEPRPGHYDFASVRPILHAAEAADVQVIWDLCHFGWPDGLDIFQPGFVTRLAEFAAAFTRFLAGESGSNPCLVPVNEISFFSWAGGEEGALNPHGLGRGFELKCQLVRAAIAAMEAVWRVNGRARFAHVDPIIHVVAHPGRPQDRRPAEAYRLSQYQGWDMLAGRLCPELGGQEKYLDILGVNYYLHNQWIYDVQGCQRTHEFEPLSRTDPAYRPLRELLREVYDRYHRPLFIAETGAEDAERGPWFDYVVGETEAAMNSGVPVEGICIYPILNHPGWVDDRHCHNGLWDYADDRGYRKLYEPLAAELQRWQKQMGPRTTSRRATATTPVRPNDK